MKKLKIFILIGIMIAGAILLTGCTEVNRVSHNIGQQADNFNITRRIVVMNARTDTVMFELIGNFSLQNNMSNELEIICEVADNVYKKLEYIIHCKKTETERSELIEKTEFGEKYFGRDWYPISNGNICSAINYIAREKPHYSYKKKLEKEFKGE